MPKACPAHPDLNTPILALPGRLVYFIPQFKLNEKKTYQEFLSDRDADLARFCRRMLG